MSMNAKLSITPPECDPFIVTDTKGKVIAGNLNITMNPDTSYCLFAQKGATIGIVPKTCSSSPAEKNIPRRA
jgi:hypothetical protein